MPFSSLARLLVSRLRRKCPAGSYQLIWPLPTPAKTLSTPKTIGVGVGELVGLGVLVGVNVGSRGVGLGSCDAPLSVAVGVCVWVGVLVGVGVGPAMVKL